MVDDLDSRTRTDVRGAIAAQGDEPMVLVSVFDGAPSFRPLVVDKSVRLGREGAEVVLADSKVSRLHAELRNQRGDLSLRDLGSRNGTWRNGEQVGDTPVALAPGDVVRLGWSLFVCARWPAPPARDVDYRKGPLIGGPALDPVRALIRVAAGDKRSVLVLGETGTGKELVAELVHQASGRSGKFVALNCGALPDTLVESELFGHVRGAFSGSHESRQGLIRRAEAGTLFLDEIGELPAAAQAVLLRVMEEGKVRPVGADATTNVDVRIIAATHRNLNEMVLNGSFRADLFHRLAVHVIGLPPLRDRPEDVGPLAQQMLATYGIETSADALEAFLGASFEGNVRGLRNAVDHAVAHARARGATRIDLGDLPALASRFRTAEVSAVSGRREELERALTDARGNMAKAARSLAIHRSTLYAELLRHGLDPKAFRNR